MLRKINVGNDEVEQVGERIKKWLIITVACFIYGAGISLFIDPNNMAPGGFTGIAVILSRLLLVDTGTVYLLLNIPVLFLAVKKFGWSFTASTLYAVFAVSVATSSFSRMEAATNQPILGALFGGVLIALGMGIVLRSGVTTGGVDIIIKCLRIKYPHMKTGTLMLIIDAVIAIICGFVFKNSDAVMYSVIAAASTSQVLDIVLYGRDGAKLIYIISDKATKITERILNEVGVGVTHLSGSGAYHNKEKKIIMCVVRKQLAHKMEEVVRQEDALAFMIVTSATEIYGEGYKSYFGEII